MKIIFKYFIILLFLSIKTTSPYTSDDKTLIVSIPFETKYIHEIPNDSNEDYYNDYGTDFFDSSFSSQDMINEWFFNGIYFSLELENKKVDAYLFLDVQNSDFTFGQCNKINTSSFPRLIKDYSYYFSNSSFSEKEEEDSNKMLSIQKEKFSRQKEKINNVELKFILNKINLKDPICGNIGLNVLDKQNDIYETNLLKQFKDNDLISNYIWTIIYRAEQFGNIIFGGEPHLYDGKNYFLSQYKTTYANLKINSKKENVSPWSLKFNNIYIKKEDKSKTINENNIIYINNYEAELLIDQGLIIGTQEYKNLIDNEFFNELFDKKICKNEIVEFNNKVNQKSSKYYVYSCEKEPFQGKDIYYSPIYSKPFFNFPSINFYNKDFNYTFSLINTNLFITKGRVYFMIIFEYEKNNKIWKLGEPFISKFKLVFNPDQKTIGFYNPNLPQIDNDIYIKNKINNDNDEIYEKEKNLNKNYLYHYIFSIITIIILIIIIIFLAKKVHKERKKRINELDDNFNYTEVNDNIIND